jgi:hypothetical protein
MKAKRRTSAGLCSALALQLLFASTSIAGVLSEVHVNPANAHSYFMIAHRGWTESEAIARAFGGHLASIADQAENDWVFERFSRLGRTPRNIWIGLTDREFEGVFVWTTGEAVTFTGWAPGEPNGDPFAIGSDFTQMITIPFNLLTPRTWNDNSDDPGDDVFGVVEMAAVAIAGDTNFDDSVDLDDLNQVRNHFGEGETNRFPTLGEAYPFDGVVDLADLNAVRNAFGTQGTATSVPEPEALRLAIALLAILACVSYRAR